MYLLMQENANIGKEGVLFFQVGWKYSKVDPGVTDRPCHDNANLRKKRPNRVHFIDSSSRTKSFFKKNKIT
jgi:hypothetical protein